MDEFVDVDSIRYIIIFYYDPRVTPDFLFSPRQSLPWLGDQLRLSCRVRKREAEQETLSWSQRTVALELSSLFLSSCASSVHQVTKTLLSPQVLSLMQTNGAAREPWLPSASSISSPSWSSELQEIRITRHGGWSGPSLEIAEEPQAARALETLWHNLPIPQMNNQGLQGSHLPTFTQLVGGIDKTETKALDSQTSP